MGKTYKITILVIVSIINLLFAQDMLSTSSKISPILKSAILPGWGEYELNESSRGNFFRTTEIVGIALTAFSFVRANSIASTYQGFAAEHAKVDIDGKSQQFWVDIGNYNSRIDYNDEYLRLRESDNLYPIEANWAWNWDTEKKRKEFKNLRIKSDQMKLAGKFFIGGIVLNHIISAIDVYYLRNISLKEKLEVSSNFSLENQSIVYSIHLNL